MLTDMVKDIGGEHAEISGMMGPGVDPHLFKATPSNIRDLQRADVIFYSGLHLEGRLIDVLEKIRKRGRMVYAITASIPEKQLLSPSDFKGQHDPHIWFDPNLWIQGIDVVVEGLSKEVPEQADYFKSRGESLRTHYEQLHQWSLEQISQLEESKRILITSHDAFNYFGSAYGFQVVGVQGISTVSEAGIADINNMVEYIKTNKVKAIFVESSVSHAAIERISEYSGAFIGGELYSDATGIPGEIENKYGEEYDLGTYEGLVKHNIFRIVSALK